MTVCDLLVMLQTIADAGKGHYIVTREGYGDDLEAEMVGCDDDRMEVWL